MKNYLFLAGILCLLASCSVQKLPKPKDFLLHVKGLHFETSVANQYFEGEIIEVQKDNIKLLSVIGNQPTIKIIPKSKIHGARIFVASTSDNPKKVRGGAALINLTSLAHGYWGVITFPINIIITSAVMVDTKHASYAMTYPKYLSWKDLHKFARFPQGIPENVNMKKIR